MRKQIPKMSTPTIMAVYASSMHPMAFAGGADQSMSMNSNLTTCREEGSITS